MTEQMKVIAVSGGVDSVVLLAMMVERRQSCVVVHVDHGIRPTSHEDAVFVEELARSYNAPFYTKRYELGAGASEEKAREARYAFLREVAQKVEGVIVTAHHADDVIETMAINSMRGTGWRGIAVFGARDIERPLVRYTKAELIRYAIEHQLDWREDATNDDLRYTRNTLRSRIQGIDATTRRQLIALWEDQTQLVSAIDDELSRNATTSRYSITNMPPLVAREIVRYIATQRSASITRPQADRLVLAIKVAKPGTTTLINRTHMMVFSQTQFHIKQR